MWKQLFIYPVGVNKDFIKNLVWQHHHQQQLEKISTNKNNKISINSYQKVFRDIYRKRHVLRSLFSKVSGLQPAALSKERLRHRCFHTKLLRTRYFIEHLGRLFLEEHKILLKTVPIAIPNDISEVYYQEGFVICFLRETYCRFMDFLIETYKKKFSLFLNFSCSLPNA